MENTIFRIFELVKYLCAISICRAPVPVDRPARASPSSSPGRWQRLGRIPAPLLPAVRAADPLPGSLGGPSSSWDGGQEGLRRPQEEPLPPAQGQLPVQARRGHGRAAGQGTESLRCNEQLWKILISFSLSGSLVRDRQALRDELRLGDGVGHKVEEERQGHQEEEGAAAGP